MAKASSNDADSKGALKRRAGSLYGVAAGVLVIGLVVVLNEKVLGVLFTEAGRIVSLPIRVLIGLMNIACVIAGCRILTNRYQVHERLYGVPGKLVLTVLLIVFTLMAGEIVGRIYYFVRVPYSAPTSVPSEEFGWVSAANVTKRIEGGAAYGTVNFSSTTHGFRLYGDPLTSNTKILIIGDSYTHGLHVSDGDAYFDYLDRVPGITVFAFGTGGYGTLQEFMALDRHLDEIQPDVVLLQASSNDPCNNLHDFESRSLANNNMMRRPYFEDGQVVFRYPENPALGFLSGQTVHRLAKLSHLMRLLRGLNAKLLSRSVGTIEERMTAGDPIVIEAHNVTAELLRRARQRTGTTPFYVFSVTAVDKHPYYDPAGFCREADVPFIPGIGEKVDEASVAGETVDGAPYDTHWNARGHEIAGNELVRQLRIRELLPEVADEQP